MADDNTALPEGTDAVIAGASQAGGARGDTDTALLQESGTDLRTGNSEGGIADRIRSGRDKLSGQAGDRARGFVGQGLERSSEALANVGRMIGDTASGIDDRLGNEYGDYARRAASAIESASNTIARKDPDELIEDARNYVRNSPGVALAGAAVVGFVVARLLKSGLATNRDEEDDRD
jgi:ElaB/YqjD/DUF883 family membrane-anchored ribosome-binding protein